MTAAPGAPLALAGVVGGVAWSASLREYMVELAGVQSEVHWAGTFLSVLLPGAIAGGLYGWAGAVRRRGGSPHGGGAWVGCRWRR